jgi:hypothetical protein
MYNVIGQLKKQQSINFNRSFILPLNELASGMYMLQLVSSSGKIFSERVIIE